MPFGQYSLAEISMYSPIPSEKNEEELSNTSLEI